MLQLLATPYRRERKLRKLGGWNEESFTNELGNGRFLYQIPLSNNLPGEVKLSLVDEEIPTKHANAEVRGRKDEEVHSSLKEKEGRLI